jgi:hypothetical protein
MPTWKDVVDYEEGDKATIDKLQSGYPRFFFLLPVQKLHAKAEQLFAKQGESAMCVPSARVAIRLQKFLLANGAENVTLHDLFAHRVYAVTFPSYHAATAKTFWQHCGEIVSSRLAAEVLDVVDQTCWENTARLIPCGARFCNRFTLEDAIGSHACSLEASMRVTNDIPLGCPLPLTITTANSIQILKI